MAALRSVGGALSISSLKTGLRFDMNSCTPRWLYVFQITLFAASCNCFALTASATPPQPASAVMVASHGTPAGTRDAAGIKVSRSSTMRATLDPKSVTDSDDPCLRSDRLTTAVRAV